MRMKTKLLAAGSALMLSAGAALAAPATVSNDLNMRSGPGTGYGVVATIPAGATVDVGGCTGSWCEVNYRGASGFASASYLSGGGGGPSAAVVVPDYAYGDDYYDDSFSYGPSIGFYAGPRFRHGWHGRPGWQGHRTGNWQGQRTGNWQGQRTGNWQGRPSGDWQGRPGWRGRGSRVGAIGNQPAGNAGRIGAMPGNAGRMGAAPGSVNSVGAARVGGQMSAPAGLRGGGATIGGGARGGAAGAGAIQRGQGR